MFETASQKAAVVSRVIAETRSSNIDPDLKKAGEVAKLAALTVAPLVLIASIIEAASHVRIEPETVNSFIDFFKQPPFNQSLFLIPLGLVYKFRKHLDPVKVPLRERERPLPVDSRL